MTEENKSNGHYILSKLSGFGYTDPSGEQSERWYEDHRDALTEIAQRQIENGDDQILYFRCEDGEVTELPNWDPALWIGIKTCSFCKDTYNDNSSVVWNSDGDRCICYKCAFRSADVLLKESDETSEAISRAVEKPAKKKAAKKNGKKK